MFMNACFSTPITGCRWTFYETSHSEGKIMPISPPSQQFTDNNIFTHTTPTVDKLVPAYVPVRAEDNPCSLCRMQIICRSRRDICRTMRTVRRSRRDICRTLRTVRRSRRDICRSLRTGRRNARDICRTLRTVRRRKQCCQSSKSECRIILMINYVYLCRQNNE
jgi:hypothetical protein